MSQFASAYSKVVVPANVTVVPVRSLDRSSVAFPGTTMLSRTMEVHAAVAAGIAEKAVTEHRLLIVDEGVDSGFVTSEVVDGSRTTLVDSVLGALTIVETRVVSTDDEVLVLVFVLVLVDVFVFVLV